MQRLKNISTSFDLCNSVLRLRYKFIKLDFLISPKIIYFSRNKELILESKHNTCISGADVFRVIVAVASVSGIYPGFKKRSFYLNS
jgi:hypothetical protein